VTLQNQLKAIRDACTDPATVAKLDALLVKRSKPKVDTAAYDAGRAARKDGKPKTDNQYAGSLLSRTAWLGGWHDEDNRLSR
jgi:ribosome modulation factor